VTLSTDGPPSPIRPAHRRRTSHLAGARQPTQALRGPVRFPGDVAAVPKGTGINVARSKTA
jgi:hypothetical protein